MVVLALAATAHADGARRFAIVVGNNTGASDEPRLRYAEADAAKVADTLVELGDVARTDVTVLGGGSALALRTAFDTTKRRIGDWHAGGGTSAILFFYYSGHSDGISLELGPDRLPRPELRALLASTGADVRVVIVDTCRGGSLLATKSGRAGSGFDVRLEDEPTTRGEVFLTSSAANEIALESKEVAGSLFTHHLVSGLRGAADSSGDGKVTLGEAYAYAYARTRSSTAETFVGTQHPTFEYTLTGEGDLVLTSLVQRDAALVLPSGYDRMIVVALPRRAVVAEVSGDGQRRLAVAGGHYAVLAFRGDRALVAQVDLSVGSEHVVAAVDLTSTNVDRWVQTKGSEESDVTAALPQSRGVLVSAAGSINTGVANETPALGGAHVEASAARPTGWVVAVDAATARGPTFRETTALASLGYGLGSEWRRFRAQAGVAVVAGAVWQAVDSMARTDATGAYGAELFVRLGIRVLGPLSVTLGGALPLVVLQLRADATSPPHSTLIALPSAWLGLQLAL